MSRIITDEQVDAALHYLKETMGPIGRARQRMMTAANMRKRTEALKFLASEQKTSDAKKAEAVASEAWLEHANDEAVAAGEFETLKAGREAASAVIEAWRSDSANLRGMRV